MIRGVSGDFILPRVWKSHVDGHYYKSRGEIVPGERTFAAGIITPDDIEDIEVSVILDEVLGLARPQYTLRSICRVIPMDKLVHRVDIATSMTGQEKVLPLVEAEISKETWETESFDLWKNVCHVAISDEAIKRAAHDLIQLHTEDAARDVARMENSQIATELEDGSITEKVAGTAYSDWGATTSGVSDTDPLDAVLASVNYIMEKGYGKQSFFMAMHPTLWRKFFKNTWIRELVRARIMTLSGDRFTVPGYPPFKVISDVALTETPTASVGPIVGSLSPNGVILGLGPTEMAQYRIEAKGYTGLILRQWLEPKVVLDDACDLICT